MATFTSSFYNPPSKEALCREFVGKHDNDLPTPSVCVDRKVFAANCSNMLQAVSRLEAHFRVHIKTHKTKEGILMSLGHGLDAGLPKSSRIIVSTLAEAWSVRPLIEEGKITDILFGLPVAKSKLGELAELSKVVSVRVLVDSVDQVSHLQAYAKEHHLKWSVYVKLDGGYGRAGVGSSSDAFKELAQLLLQPETKEVVRFGGVYCHAGHSYGSEGTADATKYLMDELSSVNAAAKYVATLDPSLVLDLSVGATPTAHGSQRLASVAEIEKELGESLKGNLELHAGNYCCCDLQQVSTGLIDEKNVAVYLVAEVLSSYANRNGKVPGEQLINAGGLALSKDTGRIPGFGKMIRPDNYGPWTLSKVSQEHGILTPQGDCRTIPYGEKVHLLPQHACMVAAAHPWYFVVEDRKVVDVWVPAKFW